MGRGEGVMEMKQQTETQEPLTREHNLTGQKPLGVDSQPLYKHLENPFPTLMIFLTGENGLS